MMTQLGRSDLSPLERAAGAFTPNHGKKRDRGEYREGREKKSM